MIIKGLQNAALLLKRPTAQIAVSYSFASFGEENYSLEYHKALHRAHI